METDTTIDDAEKEPVSELQEVITAKEAKYLFNRLYSFFEQKNNLDPNLLNYFNPYPTMNGFFCPRCILAY